MSQNQERDEVVGIIERYGASQFQKGRDVGVEVLEKCIVWTDSKVRRKDLLKWMRAELQRLRPTKREP